MLLILRYEVVFHQLHEFLGLKCKKIIFFDVKLFFAPIQKKSLKKPLKTFSYLYLRVNKIRFILLVSEGKRFITIEPLEDEDGIEAEQLLPYC